MKSIEQWLAEYGESHKNPINKKIHWICVPTIFFSFVGIFYGIKLSFWEGKLPFNVAEILLLMVILFYMRLSRTLWIGMLLFGVFCLGLCFLIQKYFFLPLWLVCLILFAIAWIGQFYGHTVEGKRPSFLKDLQFLLIGPAWIMSFIYKEMGIKSL